MKQILLAIFLFFSLPTFGQVEWYANVRDSLEAIYLYDAVNIGNGEYVVVGYKDVEDEVFNFNADYYIAKVNEDGDKLWEKTYGGSEYDETKGIIALEDGYLIAGDIMSDDGNINNFLGEIDVWLIKIDLEGNLIWQRTYGGSDYDNCTKIIGNEDEGFLIAGYTDSEDFDLPENDDGTDGWLLKISPDGDIEWSRVYGSEGADFFNDIIQTSDGDYIVVGSKGATNERGFWVNKINGNGEIIWEQTYGESGYATSIIETNNGDFLIVGSGNIESSSSSTNNTSVIRINPMGELIWVQNYPSHFVQELGSMYPLSANKIIAPLSENEYIIAQDYAYIINENGDSLDAFRPQVPINNVLMDENNEPVYVGWSSLMKQKQFYQTGTAYTHLDHNNVDALLYNGGSSFFNNSNDNYKVPKGSVHKALDGVALWMGGIDDQGKLRVAAQTYRQGGNDFFAGPILEEDETIDNRLFNDFWEISKTDVEDFIEIYQNTDGNISADQIPTSILNYPGRNNPHFQDGTAQAPDQDLAPFIDYNQDGTYNPFDGDFPIIKGDQNIWWVYNDATLHLESQSKYPLNMETQVMAYSKSSDDYLNNATFYDYTLHYKGEETIEGFYVGVWISGQLGEYSDDYAGCDVERKMAYIYNQDTFDQGYAGYGSGDSIPAIAIKIVKSIQNESNEEVDLSAFIDYHGPSSPHSYPRLPQDYYNYMRGIWRDGVPVTYGGDGYNPNYEEEDIFPYVYPSHPLDIDGWSMMSQGLVSGAGKYVLSVGPIRLEPNEVQTLTLAILWQPHVNGGTSINIDPLFENADLLEEQYDAIFPIVGSEEIGVHLPTISSLSTDKVYPNPVSKQGKIKFNLEDKVTQKTLNVYTNAGKLIGTYPLNATGLFDISPLNLKAGLYIFEVGESNKRFEVVVN